MPVYLGSQTENITMAVTVSLSGKKITAAATDLCANSTAGSVPRALQAEIQREC